MSDSTQTVLKPDIMERAFDRLQALQWQFAPLQLLHSAAEVGLLAHLAAEPQATAQSAAEQLGLHLEATAKSLRALTDISRTDLSPHKFILVGRRASAPLPPG